MDPAVDAVLTAETIHGQLRQLMPALRSLAPVEVSEAVGQAQSLYPELWAALDRARKILRGRGVDVPVYDEARARQPPAMLGVDVQLRGRSSVAEVAATAAFLAGGVAGMVVAGAIDMVDSIGAKQGDVNRSGLTDANVALDALRAAMPEVDWAGIRRREARIAAAGAVAISSGKGTKIAGALISLAVLAAIAFGVAKLLDSSRAPTKEEIAQTEQDEFNKAKEEIAELNDTLRDSPCEVAPAERRVKLFVTHQQTVTARRLAKKFIEQCGDNAYMRSIADSK